MEYAVLWFFFQSYRDLTLVTRDGLALVLVHLSQLVLERWLRLQDIVRSQLLWLLRELIRNAVAGVETCLLYTSQLYFP